MIPDRALLPAVLNRLAAAIEMVASRGAPAPAKSSEGAMVRLAKPKPRPEYEALSRARGSLPPERDGF